MKVAPDHVSDNSVSCAKGDISFLQSFFLEEGLWHLIGFVQHDARKGISCQCVARDSTRFCSFEPPIPCSSCEAVGLPSTEADGTSLVGVIAPCTESVGGLPSVNPGCFGCFVDSARVDVILLTLMSLSSSTVNTVTCLDRVEKVNTVQSLCIAF